MAVNFAAGLKFGARSSFGAQPHNRCSNLPMGAIEVQVDGSPVLMNLFGYGLTSALDNTLCIGDGGAITDGQYLPGEIGPERSPAIRRCLITDRYVYAHAVVTGVVHPKWGARAAERIFILDYLTGCIVLRDAFAGEKAIDFGTHLHCAGSVTDLGEGQYRMTGGQARTIAAPGRSFTGAAGLTDEEKGEVFVRILATLQPYNVIVEEPTWRPSYIYGLNNTGKEDIKDGRHPRFTRWRLAAAEPTAEGEFLFAISAEKDAVSLHDGVVRLPEDGSVYLAGLQPVEALGYTFTAEAVLVDESAKTVAVVGLREASGPNFTLVTDIPLDADLDISGDTPHGTLYSPAREPGLRVTGAAPAVWTSNPYHPRSRGNWMTRL
ncbi:MAG: hypothetical protein BWY76_03229 [bacterium ADurb.Bin429]|nr:MAG: hypothetical protein BWY76_03229 [bacterium ADurb.Bin429]